MNRMSRKKHTLAIATGLSGTALALGATLWVQATAMQNEFAASTVSQVQQIQPVGLKNETAFMQASPAAKLESR